MFEAAQEQGLDLTPYCEPKPIEDIRPGDIVLSRPDGKPDAPLCFSRVARTFVNVVEELVDVAIADYATRTSGTIRTTVGHPFWVSQAGPDGAPLADPNSPHMARSMTYQRASDGSLLTGSSGWVFATDLKAGYALSSTHGTPDVAAFDQYKTERTAVYNFQVEDTHSYFVATPDGCTTWVHNTNAVKGPNSRALTPADLGLDPSKLSQLSGTLTVQNGVAVVRVAMIEGKLGASGVGAIRHLCDTARAAGATTLRIEATLANERLLSILIARYGVVTEGGVDIITIPLQ